MTEKEAISLKKQIFIRFLKEMKIYNRYKRNLFNCKINFYFNGLNTTYDEFFLCDSFCWEQTKEGEDFWSIIDDMWVDMLYYISKCDLNKNNINIIKSKIKKLYKEYMGDNMISI